MKNKLFLSTLLAACVTCVAQAETLKMTGGSKTVNGDYTVNHLRLEPGTGSKLTVSGKTTIDSNITEGNYFACFIGRGCSFTSDSIEFNKQTTYWPKELTIQGTVTTNSLVVNVPEEYVDEKAPATIVITSEAEILSLDKNNTGNFKFGKNTVVTVGSPALKHNTVIELNTEINGGSLTVNHCATMADVTLNNGTVNVKVDPQHVPGGSAIEKVESVIIMGDITVNGGTFSLEKGVKITSAAPTSSVTVDGGTFSLDEAAIGSSITVESGVLNILGDCQTGNLILNGGEIFFGESAVTLSEEGLASTVTTVSTGAMTLNSGTIYIADNYVIDLRGEALTLTENVNIVMSVASLDNAEGLTVFAEAGNVEGLDKLSVTLVDETGTEKKMAVSYNSDGSVVTSTIPEPTTATLSLLALAALAARRRRK